MNIPPGQIYKILIGDKTYSSYKFLNTETNDNIDDSYFQNINPLREKMFSKDVFSYDIHNPESPLNIVYSHVKSGIIIAGVLVLENNKTFGRTANKKRLLYKCIPDDKHLPVFLVPYDPPIGFSKIFINKYVLFKYESWINQHPQGVLVNTLGDVNDPNIFYEYQLHCKSLHVSLTKFTNTAREKMPRSEARAYESILENPHFSIEDRRTTDRVFTIDPPNSLDFDDGFSISEIIDDSQINTPLIKVSIYIANVFFWLETLGLWKAFSSRVSTIYLPDRKRPMLPTILSDNLCSLQEGQTRFTFTMDLFWKKQERTENLESDKNDQKKEKYELIDIKFTNSAINVFKNYRYEESELLYNCPEYLSLLEFTKKVDRTATNSHDIVTFWMMFMNQKCGEKMASRGIGIFRSAIYKNRLVYDNLNNDCSLNELPVDTQRVIKTWNNTAGQYVVYDKDISTEHEVLNTKSYIHITSPIRRLVDLLNMFWLSRDIGLLKSTSEESLEFFNSWLSKIDYINESMRAIRKIQTDCEMIHRCYNCLDIINTLYEGIVFGKLVKNDGAIMYMVYLESLRVLSRMTTHMDIPNYSKGRFKIFLFEDEDRVKKKIRLHFIELV